MANVALTPNDPQDDPNDVKTTQIYTHVINQNAWAIRSPADEL